MSALKDILQGFDYQTSLKDSMGLNGLDISFANFLQSHQTSSDLDRKSTRLNSSH